jgi:AraC-like DNA-binding protein
LQKFVAISFAYANTPTYFLITGKTHVQFCRKPSTPIDCGGWLMEQYILFVMIDIVRLSLGMNWWPSKIGLTYDGAAQDDERHWLRDSCIITSQPHTSIDIPLLSLLAPVTIPVGQDTAPSGQHMPTDASGSVAASLTYYLSGQNTRLDRFCDILGVSPRTLQRWLAAEGVNFQSVLDSVRHQHALDLLFSGDFKIGEIASALGYTNLSAFTRAFTKWEGCPPSRRKL